jgi:hypothetical protein
MSLGNLRKEFVTTLSMDMGTRRRIDALRHARAEKTGGLPASMKEVVLEALDEYLEREMPQKALSKRESPK